MITYVTYRYTLKRKIRVILQSPPCGHSLWIFPSGLRLTLTSLHFTSLFFLFPFLLLLLYSLQPHGDESRDNPPLFPLSLSSLFLNSLPSLVSSFCQFQRHLRQRSLWFPEILSTTEPPAVRLSPGSLSETPHSPPLFLSSPQNAHSLSLSSRAGASPLTPSLLSSSSSVVPIVELLFLFLFLFFLFNSSYSLVPFFWYLKKKNTFLFLYQIIRRRYPPVTLSAYRRRIEVRKEKVRKRGLEKIPQLSSFFLTSLYASA